MEKIVRAESGFKRFAIGVNGVSARSYNPSSNEEAIRIARELISQGHSIDLGLGQINSANLEWLGLTVETVFDSCANLKASEAVLRTGYDRARRQGSTPQTALQQALSAYNTGNFSRGFANGYVERVLSQEVEAPINQKRPNPAPNSQNETWSWDVFATGANTSVLVFN